MRPRFLIDANVPMYAAGKAGPLKDQSLKFLVRAASGEVEAATDAEVLQEILHRYLRVAGREEAFSVFDLFRRIVPEVLPVEATDIDDARALLEEYSTLTSRDAIHAAVARRHGLTIVSYDRHFDSLSFVSRKEPAEIA